MAANLIYENGDREILETPLTLRRLQEAVGGFIRFHQSGRRTFVTNEAAVEFAHINQEASQMSAQPLYGRVVVCDSDEIE